MQQPNVFNIQNYSVHDGEGIRTTIFFKGCPLSCRWCHNPESQTYRPELMIFQERCTGCGACVTHCPYGANRIANGSFSFNRDKCSACGICTDWCPVNAREIAGRRYPLDELVREAEKDRAFYEQSGGGITLSGGEVMTQDMDYIEPLCRILHEKGYSVNVDTCGYAPYDHFRRLLPYVDTFLYDIKLMDAEEHRYWTGVDNRLILENLQRLSRDGAKLNIRIPVIRGVNATEAFMEQVIAYLQRNSIRLLQVNLLPFHDTGNHKYRRLDRTEEKGASMEKPSPEQMNCFQEIFIQNGFQNTKTGG